MASKLYQKNPGRDEDWIAEENWTKPTCANSEATTRFMRLSFDRSRDFLERTLRHTRVRFGAEALAVSLLPDHVRGPCRPRLAHQP